MAHPINNDTDFATALAQFIHDGSNGSFDHSKALALQTYLVHAPNKTVSVPIVAVQGNH